MGGWIGQFLPHTSPGAVVLLGMAAYFCGVAQSPLTATIIVMEICDNQQVTLALLATAFLAFGVSRMICPHPLYSVLATGFMEKTEQKEIQKKLIRARKRVLMNSDPDRRCRIRSRGTSVNERRRRATAGAR